MKIKSIYIKNFKSFTELSLSVQNGFTVITGPNGSGKSNIFDAILFATGCTSPRKLRYKHLSDLVHKGSKDNIASVRIVFDNGEEIERLIVEGTSVFRINGKRTTQDALSSYLSSYGIKSDGHNIVMQDDIKKVADLKEDEILSLLEDVSHVSKFDEQKKKAMKNLDVVNDRIRENNLILSERQDMIQKLKSELESLDEYSKLSTMLKNLNYTSIKKELEGFNNSYQNYSSKLANTKLKINESLARINVLNDEIESKNAHYSKLESDYNDMQVRLSKEDSKINEYKSNLNLLNARLSELIYKETNQNKELELNKARLLNLKSKLETHLLENNSLLKEYDLINSKIQNLGGINTLKAKIDDANKTRKANEEKLKDTQARELEIRSKISALELKKSLLEKDLLDYDKIHSKYISDVERKSQISDSIILIKSDENKYSQKLEQLTKQRDGLELDLESIKSKINELKSNIKSLHTQIETLNSISDLKNNTIEIRGQSEIDAIMRDYESRNIFGTFVFYLHGAKSIGTEVFIKSLSSKSKIDAINTELLNSKLEEQTLTQELSKISEEFRVVLNDIQATQNKLSELKSKQSILEVEFNSINSSPPLINKSNIESEIKQINLELKTNNEQVNSLYQSKMNLSINDSSEYISIIMDREDLQSKISNLKDLESKIKFDIDISESNIYNNTNRISEINLESDTLRKQISLAQSEMQKLNVSILELDLSGIKDKLMILRSELSRLKSEFDSHNMYILRSDEEILGLKNSMEIYSKLITEKSDELSTYMSVNENLEELNTQNIKAKIIDVQSRISSLGNVNMNARKDYEEYESKYGDVLSKIEVLTKEKDDLLININSLSQEKHSIFLDYFNKINMRFKEIAAEFSLGTVYLEVAQLPNRGVQIISEKNNHKRYLGSFSGGEKSLTTIALILAIAEFDESEFYIFDEFDAALDYKNTGKVLEYLIKVSKKAQILVISHNPETVSKADNLVGISKNKAGTTVVAVKT